MVGAMGRARNRMTLACNDSPALIKRRCLQRPDGAVRQGTRLLRPPSVPAIPPCRLRSSTTAVASAPMNTTSPA